jgi:hypothetical protein
MPASDDARDELATTRAERARARAEALLAYEAVRRAERDLAALGRTDGARQRGERARLARNLRDAQSWRDQLDTELAALDAAELEAVRGFAEFSDPVTRLGQCDDAYPILLLPLRLETRFKRSAAGAPQLWVRIYPDACLVDTFEPALTETEIAGAQQFWAAMWRAGGDEALEREAWRALVAAHGSGRSGWIVRQYLPINVSAKPEKLAPTDVLLIIIAPGPLPAEAVTFWEAMWNADGDAAAVAAARAALAVLGEAQASDIEENRRPVNFADGPPAGMTHAEVRVSATVLQLTPAADLNARRTSWSSAARIDLLPERFVVVTYRDGRPTTHLGGPVRTPLAASPDPNAPLEEQLRQVDDTLQIPSEIAWMFDFDKAEAAGMALRIDLGPEEAASGFDRVIVLGVRLSDTPQEGLANLGTLLEHHLCSRAGLSLLPQGTPTNNTEKSGSGYTFRDDSEASFDIFVRDQPQYTPAADPRLRCNGERLAELLGLPDELVQRVPNAGGQDHVDARAMQVALWPGTLGYLMQTLLHPVFSNADVARTREFFTRHVTGRGPLPALRIGPQPYGILPITDFARVNWYDNQERRPFLGRLHELVRRIEAEWDALTARLSFIGKPGVDPHQVLLDVLGLHSGAVEYHPMTAESTDHKFFELAFLDFSVALGFLGFFPSASPLSLLRDLGYDGDTVPDLLHKLFKPLQTPLTGPLIDDRPLSETAPIRDYAGTRNYIEWLLDAANSGIAELQAERGFDEDKKPAALLYLLLRHALQLAYHDTGVQLYLDAGLLENPAAVLREPPMVHVQAEAPSESRYALLYQPAERITGTPGLALGDYIATKLHTINVDLREQLDALAHLAGLSTARLERVFAEHLDCVSYRLDAWKTGLIAARLEAMRPAQQELGAGLYLGAFGWLEPLRPEDKALEPAQLAPDIAKLVNQRDTTPLLRDPTNGGLIHAPSLAHATTAAVLRNGYLANDGKLAVNLSSRRVRLALGILEGMQGGQSLGALLGYQFERHVHDNGPVAVRDLIYVLRREFPLAANQIGTTTATSPESGTAQESIAAINVVDGRKMIERVEGAATPPNLTYPFGIATLPGRPADQEQAITNALRHIRDINDAVADLVLSEGVHQAVSGNYERSAGTLDAFAKGTYPPEPDVVRTPRTGTGLTLRFGIHFPAAPPANPMPFAVTPLAMAHPAMNAWLAERLPAAATVGCTVTFTDRVAGEQTLFVEQAQIGLHPIDVLFRAQAGTDQAVGDLEDRILHHIESAHAPRHDLPIVLGFTVRVDGRVNWFELQALLRSLRELLVAARPLQPADLMRANDAQSDEQAAVELDLSQVQDPRNELGNAVTALAGVAAAVANAAVTVDDVLTQFATTVARFAAFRLQEAGTGFVYEWRAREFAALCERIMRRATSWTQRLDRYDARVAAYDALAPVTPDPERIALLRDAELLIGAFTDPIPTDPDDYRNVVLPPKRGAFAARRDAMHALVANSRPTLAQLLTDTAATRVADDFDFAAFTLTAEDAEVTRFRTQLAESIALLDKRAQERSTRVDELLAQHDGVASASERAALLQQGAKALFGEDFALTPRIRLPADAADELANAWAHSVSGDLTEHLRTVAGRDFPVDDWLHGVARVRDKMRHWENVVLLGQGLAPAAAAELTPLQIPFVADEPWLALEFPSGHAIAGDRLLYSAHFAEPFDRNVPVCGLLVDEWTEVIPGATETTGITFHYDRPNCEPPQTWLLALAARRDGGWTWEELLNAVDDTLDSAKRRTIEPVHLDTTRYAWFLPATNSAYTFPEISISNNLLRNVGIYEFTRSVD